jgi:hypothetical protein
VRATAALESWKPISWQRQGLRVDIRRGV